MLSADELTSEPMPQQEGRLRGTAEQLTVALRAYAQIGVEHLVLQFMVPRRPEGRDQTERFAREVIPALRNR